MIELAHFYAVDSALQDYEEFIMQELHEPWVSALAGQLSASACISMCML